MGLNLNLNKKTKKLGKVTGAMFSKKRQQEYKDRNWAMDSTTHAPMSSPTPKSTNPLLKSEFFPSIKAPTKIKSPKAPPKRKATKVLVKKKATAIKAPKSAGISAVSQRPKAKSVKVAKPKQGLVGKKATAPKAKVSKSTKLTRSQKIRAKGEAALKSGDTAKARRLRRRYDRVAAREAKRAGKKS
jgi:hypothetical protein